MQLELEGKVAVVTGAGLRGGIGWAITQRFLEEGVKVALGDIVIAEEYTGLTQSGNVTTLKVDLSTPNGPSKLIDHAMRTYGRLDFLVNNLGISPARPGGFMSATDEQWRTVFEINLFSAVRATRAALPHLLERGGVVVSMSSTLAHQPIPQFVDYAATKAALLSLTQSLSEEYAPRGVRVLAISAGPVRTPQWTQPGGQFEQIAKMTNTDVETVRTKIVPEMSKLSVGRMVEPEEIGAAIAFAVSRHGGTMTGSEIVIDAGAWKSL